MPDYMKGKIYRIVSDTNGLAYYGSTTGKLSARMAQHRYCFRRGRGNCTSRLVLAGGDAKIFLVEKFQTICKEDLIRRERFHIENNECVNRRVPGRGPTCEHGKYRQYCKECGGSQICQHDRQRAKCKFCNGDRYRCEPCNQTFSSGQMLGKHLASKKHAEKPKQFL